MQMSNPERAISKLAGETHALFMFAQVLAKANPSPQILSAELEAAEQFGLAGLEPHPIDDAAIEAFQDTVAGIRRALAANPLYTQHPQP
jgi:hypothetical protein